MSQLIMSSCRDIVEADQRMREALERFKTSRAKATEIEKRLAQGQVTMEALRVTYVDLKQAYRAYVDSRYDLKNAERKNR